MEMVATHRITVDKVNGTLMFARTRSSLVARLRRVKGRPGQRLANGTIEKIANAYMAVVSSAG
jgi:hypothetical protein